MCPPAQLQILQQEFHTQKQVRTIQSLRVFILYLCRCVNRAHVMPLTADCYFRHWLSTGRYSWYFLRVWEVGLHRGCAFCGARFRIIIQNSPGVVPEQPVRLANGVNDPVTICLLFASLWRWSASCRLLCFPSKRWTHTQKPIQTWVLAWLILSCYS